MVVNTAGAILLLVVAAILAGVVVDGNAGFPDWLRVLAAVTAVVAVVSALRVYRAGLRRKRADSGPRTRIVLMDNSSDPRHAPGAETPREDVAD